MVYKPKIGLEIHARLFTKRKIFCGCENSFGGEPNTRICPVCTGVYGSIPVLNKEAVELGIKAGVVLGCEISGASAFDRKNYVSPDLPKGYQITQQFKPLCKNGGFEINGVKRRINNIHLEEDAAKLTYTNDEVLVDYNRCGVPLIEIVTEPDFETSEEVSQFVEELALRLRYADVCDGRIEQGSLRVDVNVSVAPDSSAVLGTRCEIKNIGSLKSLRRAIEYEIKRQTIILEGGGTVLCETRRFDEASGKTVFMRMKESAADYRYFPDPDIPALYVEQEDIEKIKSTIPVLPTERFNFYTSEFGLTEEEAKNIVSDREFSDWFESVCAETKYPKKAASLMLVGLNRLFNKFGGTVSDMSLTAAETASLADLWGSSRVSAGNAMIILESLFLGGGNAVDIAKKENMLISFDSRLAEAEINKILGEKSEATAEYKAGNKKIFGYLMGLAVSRLGKNTDPAALKQMLENCLKNL
ncbi:MAG: Asp-tRNA(Asn)/Glu-tRNA(Gln) amidotransferase subunit GatB [Clostridia bacterium]|nr:Asp-tRNA(Asn)/Glu-tRNA(Gln) amidotransferase subunit GatB [Clostridia bacterium]